MTGAFCGRPFFKKGEIPVYNIRCSTCEDIPALRELWTLAFGDGGDYLDNFFAVAYSPEQMLVLEEAGVIRAMTYWFDTPLVRPDGGRDRCAYLYAVATHPDCRSRGLAGRLLAWADRHLEGLGIGLVSTVPATPSLHRFFAANGFSEAFSYSTCPIPARGEEPGFALSPLTGEAYGALREELLEGETHVSYDRSGLDYQAGCCRISGGGLYAARTPAGRGAICAEGMEDGSLLIKELLGSPEAVRVLLAALPVLLPGARGSCRIPGDEVPFGMLKKIKSSDGFLEEFPKNGYLGLAFD